LSMCENWKTPGHLELPEVQVVRNHGIKHSDEKNIDRVLEPALRFALGIAGLEEHASTRPACNPPQPGGLTSPQPVLTFDGYDFMGQDDDYEDLTSKYDGVFCGALSISFRARWDALGSWSRIIDFSSGPMRGNIIIGNKEDTDTLFFAVLHGHEFKGFRDVEAPHGIQVGVEAEYLCTVTEDGRMRIYIDGEQVADNPHGHAPPAEKRRHLYIGKSAWKENAMFRGKISDLRVWNAAIGVDDLDDLVEVTDGNEDDAQLDDFHDAPAFDSQGHVKYKVHKSAFAALPVYGILLLAVCFSVCGGVVGLKLSSRFGRARRPVVATDTATNVPLCNLESDVEDRIGPPAVPYESPHISGPSTL